MAKLHTLWVVILLSLICGCDSEKATRLEKQNEDLQAQIRRQSAALDLDVQSQCSRAAGVWFKQRWKTGSDKDTILLDYTNHYNKAMNKCFINVEFHYHSGARWSWANNMSMWDVYENLKYAEFIENHAVGFDMKTENLLITCDVQGTECKTAEEYSSRLKPFMND